MPRAKPVKPDAPTEPIWWLRALPYLDYRNSTWWRRRRQLYIETRATEKSCDLCGITHVDAARWGHPEGRIEITFSVHHRTYRNLGSEPDSDLSLLCAPCHNLIHRPESHAARHWLEIHPELEDQAESFRPLELA